MKSSKLHPRIFSILLVLFFSINTLAQSEILVLNSYHQGFIWTDNIVEAVIKDLKAAGHKNIDIEYIDSKEHALVENYYALLKQTFSHKFQDKKFDVILTTDDNAFNFVRENHKELFFEAPVVFAGVNNEQAGNIVDRTKFTGILEVAAERENLDLILKIHPATKKIILIFDDTPTGNYRWNQIAPLLKNYPDIEFERIKGEETLDELESYLGSLDDNTFVLFGTYYLDQTKRYISLKEGVERLTLASRRPIYTLHAQVLEHGAVGGYLLSGSQHGERMVKMANRILNGEKPEKIPIVINTLGKPMFNYSQIQRFKIDIDSLPADSNIIGRHIGFFQRYKYILICVGLLFVSIGVLIHKWRIRQIEKARLRQEKFSERLINAHESERKRIASDLHDGLGQNLLIIKNWNVILQKRVRTDEEIDKIIGQINECVSNAIEETREIARNLLPVHLTRLGLTTTIKNMISHVENSSNIEFESKIDDIDGLLSEEEQLSLYRVVQECLNNIIKHSHSSKTSIVIKRKKSLIVLTIKDNGNGFNAKDVVGLKSELEGIGINNMIERIKLHKGRIKITSELRKGTKIEIVFLLSQNPAPPKKLRALSS